LKNEDVVKTQVIEIKDEKIIEIIPPKQVYVNKMTQDAPRP
jgi:hypothetical protein